MENIFTKKTLQYFSIFINLFAFIYLTIQIISHERKMKNTPLHKAAKSNKNPNKIRALINKGADVNARNSYGNTPLHNATIYNNFEVVTALIDAGSDVNAKNNDDDTPLHCALDPEIVKMLIKAGADVNAKNKDGNIPLHYAWDDPETIKILLEAGADVNTKDKDGKTPLDFALEIDEKHINPEVINILRAAMR